MGLRLVAKTPLGISKAQYDPEKDGVSPTLLSKWRQCREKARLSLLGWRPRRSTGAQVFGTLCHAVLEYVYGEIQRGKIGTVPTPAYVKKICTRVEKQWKRENPKADATTLQEMEGMMALVETIMPTYFAFWHKDLTRMDWYHLEQYVGDPTENRAYGKYRTHLRGKLDGAYHVPRQKKRPWLFETKTKSRIGEQGESNLVDILPFEAQTSLYLGALQDRTRTVPAGVLMNIIRRPGQKQKKSESMPQFVARIAADIEARPDYYFLRFRMEVSARELQQVRAEMDGVFADFLAWYHGDVPHYRNSDQCENKYGTCEFLKVCSRRDYTGMYQRAPRRGDLEEVM